MYCMKILIVSALALTACGCAIAAPAAPPPKTIRLLTVGNSFSGNATRYIIQLAAAAGHKIVLARADLPGCPMERHCKAVEAAEADPNATAGKPYTVTVGSSKKHCSLKEILASDKWDFVTIQQASAISPDVGTYRPYAKNLRDFIKKNSPQAEVLIHETWAYRRDDPRFDSGKDSQEKMHADLRTAYQTIAKELSLRVIPVGDALYAAGTDPAWGYRPVKFDKAGLKHPNLPDQTHSLNVGWQWLKDASGEYKLTMDGHHASDLGCYLAGCAWFEVLFNESVENNSYVPRGIPAADARYLRAVAHKTVQAK